MHQPVPPYRPWVALRRVLVAALLSSMASLPTACLYDEDDRCDARQRLLSNETCVCEEGFVFRGQTCVPCGEHEQYESGACVCEEGYARTEGDDGRCIESGAGTACDPSAGDAACEDPSFDVCRDHGDGIGYCTKACVGDDDCPRGFACDTASSPATCMSAPLGQGDVCASDDDCAGKDATYCEVTVANACLVQGCSVDNPLSCSEGLSCCDLTPLGVALTLCIPEENCLTGS